MKTSRVGWVLVSMFISGGCLPIAKDVIGDSDSAGGTAETGGSGDEAADVDMPDGTGMVDGADDGADDSGPGGDPVPGVVNCKELNVNGPTVGGGPLAATGFPAVHCNPRMDGPVVAGEYNCCSVDPAAENGDLPEYLNKGIQGSTPYFSEANNSLGSWGLCIKTDDIPTGSGLLGPAAMNCPIPCNPTWAQEEIDVVCGPSRVCCQAHELQEADCVMDTDGQWRAVTGSDVGGLTDWASGAHATHQDPSGTACLAYAGGDPSSPIFADCVEQLTVADQRGLCMALSAGQACPLDSPAYVSACDALNGL